MYNNPLNEMGGAINQKQQVQQLRQELLLRENLLRRVTQELARSKLHSNIQIREEKTILKLSTEMPILETLMENYDQVIKEAEVKGTLMMEDIASLEKQAGQQIEEKGKL